MAAALGGDDHHHACVDLFTGLHLADRRLLVPGTVAAEVGYLLNREAGARVEALFLTALADGDFTPVDLTGEDYRRAAELVTTYADFPWARPTRLWLRSPSVWASRRSPRWTGVTSPWSGRNTWSGS